MTLAFVSSKRCRERRLSVYVGGGLGRTPIIGEEICSFLPKNDLLSYLEQFCACITAMVVATTNKARIKILMRALGTDAFRQKVEEEWQHLHETDMKVRTRVRPHEVILHRTRLCEP